MFFQQLKAPYPLKYNEILICLQMGRFAFNSVQKTIRSEKFQAEETRPIPQDSPWKFWDLQAL